MESLMSIDRTRRLIAPDGEELRLERYPRWAHDSMRQLFQHMVDQEEGAQPEAPKPWLVADAQDAPPRIKADSREMPMPNRGGSHSHPQGKFRIESRRYRMPVLSPDGSHAYSALVDPDGYVIATRHYLAFDRNTGNAVDIGTSDHQLRALEYLRNRSDRNDKYLKADDGMDAPDNQAFMIFEGTEDEMWRKWQLGRVRADELNRLDLRYEPPDWLAAGGQEGFDKRLRNSNAGNHADVRAMSEGQPYVLPAAFTHHDVWGAPGIVHNALGDARDQQFRLPPYQPTPTQYWPTDPTLMRRPTRRGP
jgi:hypothetical protein